MATSFDVFFLIKVLKILNVCETLQLLPFVDMKPKHLRSAETHAFPIIQPGDF